MAPDQVGHLARLIAHRDQGRTNVSLPHEGWAPPGLESASESGADPPSAPFPVLALRCAGHRESVPRPARTNIRPALVRGAKLLGRASGPASRACHPM